MDLIMIVVTDQETVNYGDLQKNIDLVVGKFGLPKTIVLLKSFINNTSLSTGKSTKIKLIAAYSVSQSIEVFQLNEKIFYKSRVPKYSQARRACFHLIKKYTPYSYTEIGDAVDLKKRTILYYNNECKDILSIPHHYKSFVEKYDILENHILDFLSKLK